MEPQREDLEWSPTPLRAFTLATFLADHSGPVRPFQWYRSAGLSLSDYIIVVAYATYHYPIYEEDNGRLDVWLPLWEDLFLARMCDTYPEETTMEYDTLSQSMAATVGWIVPPLPLVRPARAARAKWR